MKETWLFLSDRFMELINDLSKSGVGFLFLNPVDGSDEMAWKIRQKITAVFLSERLVKIGYII